MNTKTRLFLFSLAIGLSALLVGCEKEITVDLPTSPPKIVVEGSIENGRPPLVMLTWSQGYFDPADLNSLSNLFVRDASVRIWDGTDTTVLQQICTADLSDAELELAAQGLGANPETLRNLNVCLYTSLSLIGEQNKVYKLIIDYNEHHLEGATKIDRVVELDSLWFEIAGQNPDDSTGFIYGFLTDPDTLGNAYRWYSKRINHYPAWADEDLVGKQKDASFIAPIGSVFDDSFFNGLTFEFAYFRGTAPNSDKDDDRNSEAGFFKLGDTIAVRGCVIDRGVFNFYRQFENQVANQGSPFSLPANIPSNMSGGLGVWAGFGAVYDTIICR
jgi:hypothetical protein